ncbi:hypothetical protein J2X46_001904 [Nocardioides sp. BE266]|uniref:M1 family aminopeptidase n=1 Tax=Nocardioides sp. BE266 TaxID=2817725 RepID=UPI0028607F9F|nr:M1 family aminopeptidase [Nocardioides sp. BE266]MDR7252919.1 hypothetical protein [Nocardioides sp. BE266]
MTRTLVAALALALASLAPAAAHPGDHGHSPGTPGAAGIGDPYYPLYGNGGYDVRHYDLDVRYDPATDVLVGVTTMRARATQDLSSFNLDLSGLTVRRVLVDGRAASWTRTGDELTVVPRKPLRRHHTFTSAIEYDGVPVTLSSPTLGESGFFHTDDGSLVIGEPEVAATWFPVNDHPRDKATFDIDVTAPAGLEAMSNGVLRGTSTRRGWTTWRWSVEEPMAPYLATASVGEWDIDAYRADGRRYWDALDPDLDTSPQPRTGTGYALSQVADTSYKRLARTIDVPAGGGQLSFWVTRDTEPDWDYFFVEAHAVGSDEWTTLPDLAGHTSDATGFACPFWLQLHPFLGSYQTDNGDGTCTPGTATGEWWAASGGSDGYERWAVDLTPYAGQQVEVSLSYASDDFFQLSGVYVDDVTWPGGSTSFEADADPLDGWTTPGAPAGSAPNENDWIAGGASDAPPTVADVARGSLARQPEIVDFLEGLFGRYPFSAVGGIVDDTDRIGFALENQTRPIYAKGFFQNRTGGTEGVVVHELAHQWVGDDVAVDTWQHVWLNEGFASYTEWLWSEAQGGDTADDIFGFLASIPADDPFWSLTIGDPGPDALFDDAVYFRGAGTLHALRREIGDRAFFRTLRLWTQLNSRGNVTTPMFVKLAERVSGEDLEGLFDAWLFTDEKPAGLDAPSLRRAVGSNATVPRRWAPDSRPR